MDYKEAGVDVEAGDEASKIFYEASKKTFENRKGKLGELVIPYDDFSGLRMIDVSLLPKDTFLCLGFDGVGTKIEIAQRMNHHKTMAFDLFAMVCDDAIMKGGEPVVIGSVLDTQGLTDMNALKELADGYIEAAKDANVAVINGEIAELPSMIEGYGRFKYNWVSGLVWFGKKEKLFTGKEINVGDSIVVFKEKGFRSNGFSLIRKIFNDNLGDSWHDHILEGEKLGNLVLEPSKIYSKAIVNMHGGVENEGTCKIHGVAHITGGGIPSKLGRVLKASGFGAELDDLFEPCKAMKYCQELGNVEDREAYRTWNMGQGLAVVTPEPEKVIEEAKKFGIEAKLAGKVIDKPRIMIKSKGVQGKELKYDIE